MGYKDPAKRKMCQNRWYQKNKQRHIANVRIAKNKLRREIRAWIDAYKQNHPCPCGEARIPALDFHHRNPEEKDFTISQIMNRGYSLRRVQEEIEKCDVICSNCHRVLHAEE